MGKIFSRDAWLVALAAVALLSLLSLVSAEATRAAAPELLFRLQAEGDGAGELRAPNGVAADSSAKRLYVADGSNARVSEYTPWGAFVRAWGWGVADGAAELQVCGPSEPELTPPPSLCQRGIEGDGKGQMKVPRGGIAVDGAGNVWVGDLLNKRVQEFSPTGQFLLMIGGEVNATKVGEGAPPAEQNVCPIDPGDVCQAGTVGNAPSYFADVIGATKNAYGSYIAYSPTANAILVGDRDRIQIFNLDGSFREEIPFEGELAAFDEKPVIGLATDPAGDIYLAIQGLDDIYKLSPAGVPLEPGKPGASKFAVKDPIGAVALDDAGDVYGGDKAAFSAENGEGRVLEFDMGGSQLLPTSEEEALFSPGAEAFFFPYIPSDGPAIEGLAANRCAGEEAPGNLYLVAASEGAAAYLEGYGTPPLACEPPPPLPPDVTAQYATTVKGESASLRAEINPHFWPDATYYVEYGTGKCSEGGCTSKEPPTAASLTSKSISKALRSGGVFLAGLTPGTTYHYRFVAKSTGGGPVYGVDPDGAGPAEAGFEDGAEGTFRTFPPATAQPPCENEALRSGPAGELPDCRAYELVSPLDKSNGDAALLPPDKVFFELNQSSRSGDRFTYASLTPFAEPESAPYISQYMASRDPESGWRSESISPPHSAPALETTRSLNNEYKAFTADLCTGWLRHNSVATLAGGAIAGYPNIYRRDGCAGAASYEALSTSKPPTRPAAGYELNLEGFADEEPSKAIFVAQDALTADAPVLPEEAVGKEFQLYEHTPGGLRFICRLPSGAPYGGACAAGMAAGSSDDNAAAVQNAISADGSRVFWTAYKGGLGSGVPEGIAGKIYLRLHPEEEQSAVSGLECSEPEKACTIAVSQSVSPEAAQYWGAANDGSKAIFKIVDGPLKDNLYEFDVKSETSRLIAGGVEGPMGMSEDASRIYLSSTKVLGAGGGEGAKAGAHNLYLYEAPKEGGEARFTFVMALAGRDLLGTELQPGAVRDLPNDRSSTVSADGLRAAFGSSAAPTPTGYDNLDAESGQADEEVYLYEAKANRLVCVSCNPTGARPSGVADEGAWMAARLPRRGRALLNPPHPLSEDGRRLFFESHEALVQRDGNGTWDVYEWEAPGAGSCDEADSTFNRAAGGCVDLISSGESASPSKLLDVDADGSNVFIGTQSSLIATDFGSNDVYDARIGGGFPLPTTNAPCEGEACQNPPGPPADLTPASAGFEGKGNAKKPRHCRKGSARVRRHGKSRCVRKAKKPRAGRGARSGAGR